MFSSESFGWPNIDKVIRQIIEEDHPGGQEFELAAVRERKVARKILMLAQQESSNAEIGESIKVPVSEGVLDIGEAALRTAIATIAGEDKELGHSHLLLGFDEIRDEEKETNEPAAVFLKLK